MDNPNLDPFEECTGIDKNELNQSQLHRLQNVDKTIDDFFTFRNVGMNVNISQSIVNHNNSLSPTIESSLTPPVDTILHIISSGQGPCNSLTRNRITVVYQEEGANIEEYEEFSIEDICKNKFETPGNHLDCDNFKMKKSPSTMNEKKLGRKSKGNMELWREIHPKTVSRRSARLLSPNSQQQVSKDLDDTCLTEGHLNGLDKKIQNIKMNGTKILETNGLTAFNNITYTRRSRKSVGECSDKMKNVNGRTIIPKLNKLLPSDEICMQEPNLVRGHILHDSFIPVTYKMSDFQSQTNAYEKDSYLGMNAPSTSVFPSIQNFPITDSREENQMEVVNFRPVTMPTEKSPSKLANEKVPVSPNKLLQESLKKRGRGRPRRVNTFLEVSREIESRNLDSDENISLSELQNHSISSFNASETFNEIVMDSEVHNQNNEKHLRKSDRLKTRSITTDIPASIDSISQPATDELPAISQKSFGRKSRTSQGKALDHYSDSIISSVVEEYKDESSISEKNKEDNVNITKYETTENSSLMDKHQNKLPNERVKLNKESMNKQNLKEPILHDNIFSSELTLSLGQVEVSFREHECDSILPNGAKYGKDSEIFVIDPESCNDESNDESKVIYAGKLYEDYKTFNADMQTDTTSPKVTIGNINLDEKSLDCEMIEKKESLKEEKILNGDLSGIYPMPDVFITKDENYVSKKDNAETKLGQDWDFMTKLENEKDTAKIECLDNDGLKMMNSIQESECQNTNEVSPKNVSSGVEIEEDLSDYGYNTRRRSLRILLETVKKISITEAEEKVQGALRLQRCKSVPHEDISFKNGASVQTSEEHFKQANGDMNHLSNDDDFQPIRRKRAKSLYSSKLGSPTKKPMLIKTKSISPDADDNSKTCSKENNTQNTSPVNGVKKAIQSLDSAKQKENDREKIKTPEVQSENHMKTKEFNEVSSQYQQDVTLSPGNKSIVDEADLEVQRAQLANSPNQFLPIKRSRSYSQGFELKKSDPISYRSKSVTGKPKKKLRTLRHFNLGDSFQYFDSEESRIDINDLKVGDLIWGKLGSYPYWPCLIVSDPETSEFKKYKLLRSMPSYHVRFFGDKGKRAWTAHVIPYRGSNDLDKFAEEYRRQGVSASSIREDFFIRKSQRKKWDRAVAEAESLKHESLMKKLNFFDEILANASSNASVSSKASESSDENSCSSRDRIRTSKRIKKNETISLRESSVMSCINDVVTKYTSWESEDSTDDSVYEQRTSSKATQRRRNLSDSENTPDSKLGFELLDIPCLDNGAITTRTPDSNHESKTTETNKQNIRDELKKSSFQNKTSSSPKSSSKSRSRIQSHKNQLQTTSNLEIPTLKQPSTPPKIEKKQIDQCDSESGISELSLTCSSISIPQLKKNLFRGVSREKVCQICEKPGDVVKCKGQCYGDYHVTCVEKSFKLTKEQNVETNEELNSNEQVQIITVAPRKKMSMMKLSLSPSNRKMTLTEQIDRKMKEVMKHVESQNTELLESTDSSGEDINPYEKIRDKSVSKNSAVTKSRNMFKHVTADDISIIRINNDDLKEKPTVSNETSTNTESFKCPFCVFSVLPPCFVCNKATDIRQRCSFQKCGRFYHLECLKKNWPQTQWSFMLHENKKSEAYDSFVCPRHVCHMCASESFGSSKGTCSSDKVVKCLKCPATYHNSHHCIPAGTQILTTAQVICPRHTTDKKKTTTCNAIWCFVCAQGGNLICCETCPTSVHVECLPVNLMDDNTYICEDCECGRFPLYDELVWVKCGTFRWWPARILFPSEVPPNILSKPHKKGEFVVKFFGTYDFLWTGRGRAFLYIEGDTGYLNSKKGRINTAFSRALQEVAEADRAKKESKSKREAEIDNRLKPPPYVRIKINRPVGNVKVFEGNLSNTTSCDCDPNDSNPCGPNSNCLNRILLTECNPEVCPAGQKCRNRCFEKREYPQVVPYRTSFRGWGLKTLEPIKKGQFVIEYVGELIDDEEYERRIERMHQQKDENYYFLTIDRDRMLDAGPKGNAARFMNHSCQPNCETQKWTVNGDTRVGLFAIDDIPADTELTFNYNLESIGTEKKICKCGASNCSGYIGLKPEDQTTIKRYHKKKKKSPNELQDLVESEPCLICGKEGDTLKCSNKLCLKSYHWKCVQQDYKTESEEPPKGKWTCPSHTCNICSRRTMRSCVQCLNSYCPAHSEGNVRHDEILGYLCSKHDFSERRGRSRSRSIRGDSNRSIIGDSSATDVSVSNSASTGSSRSERYRKRRGSDKSIGPSRKKRKLNSV